MTSYKLLIDEDFSEYEYEVEAKGWHSCSLIFNDKKYNLNFYDPTRLLQEANANLSRDGFFMEENLIVLEKVNLINIEKSISKLVKSKRMTDLKPAENE
tara:strand:+ start:964 stop:1260 length:297 start_codon:yes stop_codon:yes gene_type:complete